MFPRNLPTNCSPSRNRISRSSGYPIAGHRFQQSISLSGPSNLPTNHSLNGAGRNTPHQQLPGQRMTEIHQQRTGYSPNNARPSYAQVLQRGHATANAHDATNWARDFPVLGTAQSQDSIRLDNYTSNNNGCYSETSLETFFDTHSYYNGASSTMLSREGFSRSHQERAPQHNTMASKKPTMSRTPEPTDLNIPGGITSHEPPWSIMNQRGDQGPTMSQPQGTQRLGFDPSIPSASTKTTTTTTTSTSIQCPYCPKCFTGKHGKGNLGRHKRQIHVSGPQSFKCERGCERSYARKDARLKHYKKHHQEQGYYLSGLTNP